MSKPLVMVEKTKMTKSMEIFTKDAVLMSIIQCGLTIDYDAIATEIRDRMDAQYGRKWSVVVAKHGCWSSWIKTIAGSYFRCTVGGLDVEVFQGRSDEQNY